MTNHTRSLTRIVSSLTVALLLGITGAGTIGCAAGGGRVAPGETAANELTRTRTEVARARPVLEDGMAALDTVLVTDAGELREPFDAFRVAVRDVTAQERRMNRQIDRMRGQRDRFLRSWRRDSERLESEDLRKRAETRATQVEQRYAVVEDRLRQFDEAFSEIAGSFRDLERFLGNDLTADGIGSVRTMRGPLQADVREALSALDVLLREMDGLATDLSPVIAVPEPSEEEDE